MMTKQEIYVLAKLLIEKHGDDAENVAMEEMLSLMESDDIKEPMVWFSVMDAIETLTQRAQQKYLL